jgi:Glu-tRNA(Gln) amidotransferase subunit E-like FAD-binding protein
VEIKGVQELDLISEVVKREVQRQEALLAIRDDLRQRGASASPDDVQNVTGLFRDAQSTVLKKAKIIYAMKLRGFAGHVGREIQPDRRLGSEMSDYAKVCGVGGIFHSDELPAYGITGEEVANLLVKNRRVGPYSRFFYGQIKHWTKIRFPRKHGRCSKAAARPTCARSPVLQGCTRRLMCCR